MGKKTVKRMNYPWSSIDHAVRKKTKQEQQQPSKRQEQEQEQLPPNPSKRQQQLSTEEKILERDRRSALLTRDSKEKHEAGKLRLHIKHVQRQLEKLRQRLEAWDDVEEEKERAKQQEKELKKRLQQEKDGDGEQPAKKKGRLGPESWKLKGAARPAWEVYDFDTRYVDIHQKAHKNAAQKTARSRNILVLCQGRFGNENDEAVPQPQCREYLSLLMQLGLLSMRSNQLKTARQAFLECIQLDSVQAPVTPARCHLMRLYMESNRPESARRLWERLPRNDSSVWIRYSAALVEFVSWKLLKENGSSKDTSEQMLARAIKSNVFCAYYLAFFDMFDVAMDYTDEIEDAHESSPLEEAIEYCNSEQLGAWKGTEGALHWIRQTLKHLMNGGSIGRNDDFVDADDLEWRDRIQKIHQRAAGTTLTVASNDNVNDEERKDDKDDDDDLGVEVDVVMFATMFETGMEMLESSGQLDLC